MTTNLRPIGLLLLLATTLITLAVGAELMTPAEAAAAVTFPPRRVAQGGTVTVNTPVASDVRFVFLSMRSVDQPTGRSASHEAVRSTAPR